MEDKIKSHTNNARINKYIIITCTIVIVLFGYFLYSKYTYTENQKRCEEIAQTDIAKNKNETEDIAQLSVQSIFYSTKMQGCYYEYTLRYNHGEINDATRIIKRVNTDTIYAQTNFTQCTKYAKDNTLELKKCLEEQRRYDEAKKVLKK